jgi:mRNA interferase MazF
MSPATHYIEANGQAKADSTETSSFMAINFHPKRGTVLMCDFETGFRAPEMVKRRHVVVVSPRYRRHTIVLGCPVQHRHPFEIESHQYEIPRRKYPFFDPSKRIWAKADMMSCVCFQRLDRLLVRGKYEAPTLHEDDLLLIQKAVASALQLDVTRAMA